MNEHIEDIRAIREMMEKSSKFVSLSGLSGVVAGIAALIGAAFAYFYLLREPAMTHYNRMQEAMILIGVAIVVLIIAVGCAFWLSWRKAHKSGQKLFDPITRRTVYNLIVPLAAGGLFCLAFLLQGDIRVAVAGTLVFYGLALINVSKYTFTEIHYLGLIEIACGIAAAFMGKYGIFFWAFGFGVCHIVYGIILYRKYDRNKRLR